MPFLFPIVLCGDYIFTILSIYVIVIVMDKKMKKYYPPHMEVFDLVKHPVLLAGSNDGNLPQNPNYPI